jgi:hypothetical protein
MAGARVLLCRIPLRTARSLRPSLYGQSEYEYKTASCAGRWEILAADMAPDTDIKIVLAILLARSQTLHRNALCDQRHPGH